MPPTTAPVPPAWRLVHDSIAHWAQVQPQAVALASECEQLTFAQLHQRVQALGPDVVIDLPVAETRGIVATTLEPPVVEHEPLHADLGCGVGQCGEPIKAMVEVHRLPGVQRHRARAPRMLRAGAQRVMETPGEFIETVAPGADHPAAAQTCRANPRAG